MSEFFDSGEPEDIFTSNDRSLRQRNAVIGILIAIIAVLVAILLVKGSDDNEGPSSLPVAINEEETTTETSER